MRPSMQRFPFAGVAACVFAGALTACGGGAGTSMTSVLPQRNVGIVPPQSAAAQTFSLGFVGSDPTTIAQLPQIRTELSVRALPALVDLSAAMPAVGNQGQQGSCVSWASAYAMRGYEARKDVWSTIAPKTADPTLNFSPAFVYSQVNGGRDAGSTIPSALSVLQQKGAATLADMPYFSNQYTVQPSAAAYADAARYKLSTYGYIAPTDLHSMKAQIAAGLPVIIAIKVYNNFFTLGSGQVYTATGGGYAGGHAITAIGYDDAKQAVEFMNSWGTNWGTAGYGWISYAALSQIALEAYSAVDDHGLPLIAGAKSALAPATPRPGAEAPAKPAPRPAPSATPAAKSASKRTPEPQPTSTPSSDATR